MGVKEAREELRELVGDSVVEALERFEYAVGPDVFRFQAMRDGNELVVDVIDEVGFVLGVVRLRVGSASLV